MTGLRERKKEAARLALHEAALRLMSDADGESVTVESIADAAGMSRRTFSNYFSSKEEAVFYRDSLRARELLALVRARPSAESPLTAFRAALDDFADTLDFDAEQHVQRRLVHQRPALAAHRAEALMLTARQLSDEFKERLGDRADAAFTADVLAATALAALRTARSRWIENQDQPLSPLIAQAMAHLVE